MTTRESNKLIAEFMGLNKDIIKQQGLPNYDTEWEEIMSVFEAIEVDTSIWLQYNNWNYFGQHEVEIRKYISKDSNTFYETITKTTSDSKIECFYDSVIEYIKWYNQQK